MVVWGILAYSLTVFVLALWAVGRIVFAEMGTPEALLRDQYGFVGLVVSMFPAAVLLLAGVFLFLFKWWAVWPLALSLLIVGQGLYLSPSLSSGIWFAVAAGALIYALQLWRRGILR
jgi:hypothetical protein